MFDAGLWLAGMIACTAFCRSGRAAHLRLLSLLRTPPFVLLASLALSTGLDWAQVPFNGAIWVLIDIGVILAILRRGMTHADLAVIALFIPAWAGYLLPDPIRFWLSWSVVVTQFMLTVPKSRPITFTTVRRLKDKADDIIRMAMA